MFSISKVHEYIDRLLDLFTQSRHSQYFNHTRAHYLIKRVRVIALLLVLFQPSWLLVDFFLLPNDVFDVISISRIICAMTAFSLYFFVKGYSLKRAYLCLIFLVAILAGFHFVSTQSLIDHGYQTSVAGYQFFVFMIMAMMAVFPLSIVESFLYIVLILSFELLIQVFRGNFGAVEGINNFWLLSVLGLIAGWSSINQLSMLLTLYRQATRDPLTGLSNRRQAMEQMTSNIKYAKEHHTPVCVLLFDLDNFKNFNDNYGHASGDLVLKEFASILKEHAKNKRDLICRYGGEEFLVVLPNADLQSGSKVAEAIRLGCHQTKIRTPEGDQISFTTSAGVACYQENESIDNLLQRVDNFLYEAKGSGRDQIKVAS